MPNTQRRLRQPTGAFFAAQSAKGTPSSVFTFGPNCARIWVQSIDIQTDRPKSVPGPWMTDIQTELAEARYALPERCAGILTALATPETVRLLMRSNWGLTNGNTWTLGTQIGEWFTLAWFEERNPASTQKVVRVQDVFVHRLTFRWVQGPTEGRLVLIAEFAGRRNPAATISGAGLTIPAAPQAPADLRVFSTANAQFRRDPAGGNVNLTFGSLDLILDQGVTSEWFMSPDEWDVYKRGKARVTLVMRGVYSSETWAILDDAIAGTKRAFRITASGQNLTGGVASLTADIAAMDFEIEPLGHGTDQDYTPFVGEGLAVKSGSDFFSLTLIAA